MMMVRHFERYIFLAVCSTLCYMLLCQVPTTGQQQTINVLESFVAIQPLDCVNASETLGVNATICVKPNDNIVSAIILQSGAWEPGMVSLVMRAMRLYPEAVFLDIGSNIGMYSVLVAAMGRKVVSVDAMADNLAYVHRSLGARGRAHLATLVHNSVSDVQETLYPVLPAIHAGNPGATRLVTADELLYSELQAVGPPTHSVILPVLLASIQANTVIIKMDIEGYECRALSTKGVFETGQFLPYILLEWARFITNEKLCPGSSVSGLLEIMRSRGYTARSPHSLALLPEETLRTPVEDVLWVHRDAKPLE